MKNKFLVMVMTCFILVFTYLHVVNAADVKVVINGTEVNFTDANPFIDDNSRTQVPVRALAESLGCTVEWREASQEVVLSKRYSEKDDLKAQDADNYIISKELHLFIGNNEYDGTYNTARKGTETVLGTEWQGIKVMDTVPLIKEDRTYLPARCIAEFFGYTVAWENNTVRIEG